MQVKREDVTPCLISFEIEVEPERYQISLEKAKKDLAKRTEVPGFRKGKAPVALLERVLDPERVKGLAAERLMPEVLQEAIGDEELQIWDSPTVDLMDPEEEGAFKFKALVPLKPKVTLGEYKGLKIDRMVRPVTDEIIDQEIERLRKQQTRLEPKPEGKLEKEDYVFVQIQELNDDGTPKGEAGHNAAVIGENVPDFDSNLIGMAQGETKEFSITYPPDWQEAERAGQIVKVSVTVNQAYAQVKPELNDEFAKGIGVESVDNLREEIRTSAERAFNELADEQVEAEIMKQIIQSSTIEYPPQMMEQEFDHRVQNLAGELRSRNKTFEQHLQEMQMDEEQYRQQMQAKIDRDIRVAMVLAHIADKESITVTVDELDEHIAAIRAEDSGVDEATKKFYTTDEGKYSLARRRQSHKVLDFLRSESNIKDVTKSDSKS